MIDSPPLPIINIPMPAPISITNAQLESVAQGLAALDGLNLKEGFVPFKFDDETTWSLAVKGASVTQAISVLQLALKSLAKQHGVTEGMKFTAENSEKIAAFFEAKDGLMAQVSALPKDFDKIDRAKLNTTKNAIPPGVLAKLMPILE